MHKKQHLSYLWLADKRLGLLINFNVALILRMGSHELLTDSKSDFLAKTRRTPRKATARLIDGARRSPDAASFEGPARLALPPFRPTVRRRGPLMSGEGPVAGVALRSQPKPLA